MNNLKKIKNSTLILVTLLVSLTSCSSASKVQATTKDMVANIIEPNNALNDIWALQTMINSEFSIKNAGKGIQIPTLEFHLKEMKYFGNDGCNEIFGAIEKVNTADLVFGIGGGTRKFCVDDEVSPVFIKNMSEVKGYTIDKTTLLLSDEKGEVLMTFRKVD